MDMREIPGEKAIMAYSTAYFSHAMTGGGADAGAAGASYSLKTGSWQGQVDHGDQVSPCS